MNKKVLIFGTLTLLTTGAMMVWGGLALEPLASKLVRNNGFPQARVKGIALTPSGFMVDHIALDSNDFSTVDGISVAVDWLHFLKTRDIVSVTVKDVSLTCETDENGQFKIAGWDATLPSASSYSALLPLSSSLVLNGITLDLSTPQGDFQLNGKLAIETAKDKLSQTLHYGLWSEQHQMSFDIAGTGTLKENGDINLSVTLNDGRLNLSGTELNRASGWIDVSRTNQNHAPIYAGQLVAGKVNMAGIMLQNVTATIDTTKDEALFFKTSPAGHEDITFTGRWLTAPNNEAQLFITSNSTLSLIDLFFPEKSADLKPWLQTLNPLALTLKTTPQSLTPPTIPISYSLNLGDENGDKNLKSSGNAVYTRTDSSVRLSVESVIGSLAGGQISLAKPLSIDTNTIDKTSLSFSLALQNLDMTKLSSLAEVNGLKAAGTLNGTLPITYKDGDIIFGQGNVTSDKSGGHFAYTPPQFPASLQGDDERMKTVREALSDFQFTKFSVTLNGPLGGKLSTQMKAEGTSPVFGDRPIHLNLNLNGDIGAVLKQSLQAGDIGDKIRSSLSGVKKP